MKRWIIGAVGLLLIAGSGIYFMSYSRFLPILGIQAKQEIFSQEYERVVSSTEKAYPQMSPVLRQRIVTRLYEENLRKDKLALGRLVSDRAGELKARYSDEQGRVYMTGIDSYYWLRLLKNLDKSGHPGDRVVDGREFDDLIRAPLDAASVKNVHLFLGLLTYRLSRGLKLDESAALAALFFIPVFLLCCIVVLTFFIGRGLGMNDLSAFFSTIAVGLNPFLITRVSGEWFDTDIYNVFFPLSIFGFFIFSWKSEKIFGRVFWAVLSALFLALYASTWKGWWFIFDIMMVSAAFFLLNQKLVALQNARSVRWREHLISLASFSLCGCFFVLIWNGGTVLKDLFVEPLRLVSIFKVTSDNVWPNVFWTVAELGEFRPFEIVSVLGGSFVFFVAMIVLVYILLIERGARDPQKGYGILCLAFWIILTFHPSVEALRLALLLVVPVGLVFGLAVNRIYDLSAGLIGKFWRGTGEKFGRCALMCLLAVYPVMSIRTLHYSMIGTLPQMDDSWHQTLEAIKKQTPEDAIVNSWWDFGHWFKWGTGRRILFDGMTQNTPFAYWVSRALLTDSELEAFQIWRMINTRGNEAVEFLEREEGFDAVGAVSLVREILSSAKTIEEARVLIASQVSEENAAVFLSLVFPPEFPSAYLIISYDMPVKISAISFVRNWDFTKADLWLKHPRLSKNGFVSYAVDRYGLSAEEAESRYLEILLLDEKRSRSWMTQVYAFSPALSKGTQEGDLVFFEDGLVVDLKTHLARLVSAKQKGRLKSLFIFEKDTLAEFPQDGAEQPFSGLIFKKTDSYFDLLLNPVLAKSLLVRLYYLEGSGLEYFKLFHKEVDEAGNSILVYEIVDAGKDAQNESRDKRG